MIGANETPSVIPEVVSNSSVSQNETSLKAIYNMICQRQIHLHAGIELDNCNFLVLQNSGENADMAFYDFCVSFLHCTGAEFGKAIDSKRLISTMDSSKCVTLLHSVQCIIILCLILTFSFVMLYNRYVI